jgi:hypothetical protein
MHSGESGIASVALLAKLLLFTGFIATDRLAPAEPPAKEPALPSARASVELLPVDRAGLPPRSVGEQIPLRPIPPWIQTHLRVGHLPGSLPMAAEFLKAGYNVVTLNVLGKWEVVGPSAHLYAPERVKEAEQYMRAHVDRCHAAGAKAVFYLGPVQVPSGNPIFVKAHPTWLRIGPDGRPDAVPNFANIRSGYADWLNPGSPPEKGPLALIASATEVQAQAGGQIISTYQKLAALPEEINKQWGFPNQSELRGTWPVREEIIPLGGVRVICRISGVTKATLQPGAVDLPMTRTADGVLVTVPTVGMHGMVVFE